MAMKLCLINFGFDLINRVYNVFLFGTFTWNIQTIYIYWHEGYPPGAYPPPSCPPLHDSVAEGNPNPQPNFAYPPQEYSYANYSPYPSQGYPYPYPYPHPYQGYPPQGYPPLQYPPTNSHNQCTYVVVQSQQQQHQHQNYSYWESWYVFSSSSFSALSTFLLLKLQHYWTIAWFGIILLLK